MMSIQALEKFHKLTVLADRCEEILRAFSVLPIDASRVPEELRAWVSDVNAARTEFAELPEPSAAADMLIDLCTDRSKNWVATMVEIREVIRGIREAAWSPFIDC